MRVLEAARLITTGVLPVDLLWQITTPTERIMIALLLGRPDQLPLTARTPNAAWDALDARQRTLLMRRAPRKIRLCLPGYLLHPPIKAGSVQTTPNQDGVRSSN